MAIEPDQGNVHDNVAASFHNLSPMGPLSHVSSSLQVGWVLRLGFAVVGWFRRFRLPPPPLVWFRFRRPPFFLSLLFQGLPALGQVCRIGVCSFPLLLCSPLRVLVK